MRRSPIIKTAIVALMLAGCSAEPAEIAIHVNTNSGQALLLVTDTDGGWAPLALDNENEAVFVPATPAFGVAFACRYGEAPAQGLLTNAQFRTVDDGQHIHIDGCLTSNAFKVVTATGLEGNQELVVNGAALTATQPTATMVLDQPEIMGVVWQREPRVVLGFVRQAVLSAQDDISIDATATFPPELLQIGSELLPMSEAGLTRFYSGSTFYDLDTFGPAHSGFIAVPPPAFRQAGDLMEIDVTEYTSATNLRYVQRLVDSADPFAPALPLPWSSPAPQLAQGRMVFSFTPRASWNGWYSAMIQTFAPGENGLHIMAVSSAWPQGALPTSVEGPDYAAFAPWAATPTDAQHLDWWSEASAISNERPVAGRELQVARTFAEKQ